MIEKSSLNSLPKVKKLNLSYNKFLKDIRQIKEKFPSAEYIVLSIFNII
jgi:hypothetical protein